MFKNSKIPSKFLGKLPLKELRLLYHISSKVIYISLCIYLCILIDFKVQVKVFGSFITGLALPSSDIDISISGLEALS